MKMPWLKRLEKLTAMCNGNAKRVFDIAIELRELHSDVRYLSEAHNGNMDARDAALAVFAEATPVALHDLLTMIDHFPRGEQWIDGELLMLRDRANAEESKRKSPTGDRLPPVTRAMYEALRQKYEAVLEEKARLLEQINKLIDKLPPGKAA